MLPKIHKNYNLKPYNTFAIAAKAKLFAKVETLSQLKSLLAQNLHQDNLFVLGGGSNILFTQDFPGLVIHNAITGLECIKEDHQYVWLQIGAGVVWHNLV